MLNFYATIPLIIIILKMNLLTSFSVACSLSRLRGRFLGLAILTSTLVRPNRLSLSSLQQMDENINLKKESPKEG